MLFRVAAFTVVMCSHTDTQYTNSSVRTSTPISPGNWKPFDDFRFARAADIAILSKMHATAKSRVESDLATAKSRVESDLATAFVLNVNVAKPNTTESTGGDHTIKLTTTFNLLLSIICIIFNSHLACYFWKTRSKLVSMVYLYTNITDICASVGILVQVVVLFLEITNVSWRSCTSYLIILSYLISGVAIRYGIFLNVILTVTRTINISQPFYEVKRPLLKVCMMLYLCLWAGLIIYDSYYLVSELELFHNTKYLTKIVIFRQQVGFSLVATMFNKTESYAESIVILQVPPFIVPGVIYLVVLLVQIYYLISRDTVHNTTAERNRPAITIAILTVIFISCTSMSVIIWLVVYGSQLGLRGKIKPLAQLQHHMLYISTSTCHLLSSILMAVVLVMRSTALNAHTSNVFSSGGWTTSQGTSSLATLTRYSKQQESFNMQAIQSTTELD